MTRWDWAYNLNQNLDLADVANGIRVEEEGGGGFVPFGQPLPGRDGIDLDDDPPHSPLELNLRLIMRWTAGDGTVTHADGEPGHILENLTLVKRELAVPTPVLYRTAPNAGDQQAPCRLAGRPFVGDLRHIYHFPLTVPSGSWQQAGTISTATGSPPAVTTSGDRRIWDPTIVLSGAQTFTLTDADGTVYTIVAAAGPTYPVTIDVGAGTILDDNGADARGDITFDHDAWCRIAANSTPTISAPSGATIQWRDRWA